MNIKSAKYMFSAFNSEVLGPGMAKKPMLKKKK